MNLFPYKILVLATALAAFTPSNGHGEEPGTPIALPPASFLIGVTFADGMFVAVGDHGTILTSTNARAWYQQTSPEIDPLFDVAYGNGQFVALGLYETIITSPDGANWTTRRHGGSDRLFGMAFGKGTFVVVGDNAILTSTDGVTWTSHDRPNGTQGSLWDVTFGNDLFVAVTAGGSILTSADGISWILQSSGTTSFLDGVTYGAGTFVAVSASHSGPILASADGTNWTAHAAPVVTTELLGVYFADGVFVAVGASGAVLTSLDASTWTSQAPVTQHYLSSVAFGNGTYVAVGGGLLNQGIILTSTDSVVWRQPEPPPMAPGVVIQPSSLTVSVGSSAGFEAVGSGYPPPAYQWQFEGMDLPGETASTLQWSDLQANQQGAYTVVASNVVGVVTSAVATLTLLLPYAPSVLIQPSNQLVAIGGSALFTAVGSGYPPPAYQWQFEGMDLPGKTASTLQLVGVQPNQLGAYTVVASNAVGVVTSAVATLTLRLPHDLDAWHWRQPLPQGNNIHSLIFAQGQFVGVAHSTIITSPDGVDWTVHPLDVPLSMDSIAFGNGRYVVVGGSTRTVTSEDGVHWVINTSSGTCLLDRLVYGNGRFVAVGYSTLDYPTNTCIASSTDGVTWTEHLIPGNNVNGVAYGNGLFVVVGHSPSHSVLFTSPDGLQWTPHDLGEGATPYSLADVTFGNGRFVALGPVFIGAPGFPFVALSSTDGVSWQPTKSFPIHTNTFHEGLAFGNGMFLELMSEHSLEDTLLSSDLFASSDATNWTRVDLEVSSNLFLNTMAFGNDRWSAAGDHGNIANSVGGSNWTAISTATPNNLRGITYGNGRFVVVGNDGTNLTSPDGVQWSGHSSGTAKNLHDVLWANGQFTAVGSQGTILHSGDGATWLPSVSGTTEDLWDIAFGNGTFVAVGGDSYRDVNDSWFRFSLLSSSDGISWTARLMLPDYNRSGLNLHGVVFGNGVFVAVGEPAAILTSVDGQNWVTNQVGLPYEYLKTVAFGNGVFVAMGNLAGAYVSSNGLQWVAYPALLNGRVDEVIFGQGVFIAVGENGSIATSPNGIEWTRRNSSTHEHLRSVAAEGGTFVIVGNNDIILQSDPLSLPPVSIDLVDQGVRVRFSGEAGDYQVQRASGVTGSWTTIATLSLPVSGSDEYTDTQAPPGQAFYRLAQP